MRDFDYYYAVPQYTGDPDFDGLTLDVFLTDSETDEIVDSVCVGADYDVSDHGNVNVDPDTERDLRNTAGMLAQDNGGRLHY